MLRKRLASLFLCMAAAVMAFLILDIWSQRNAPLFRKFEMQWATDVRLLEESGKLPKGWFDVREIELIGGTPETKTWLSRIEVPLRAKNPDGHHKLEVLVVIWEEEGTRGALVQYNLVNLKTGNMIFELGRTLLFRKPKISELIHVPLFDAN